MGQSGGCRISGNLVRTAQGVGGGGYLESRLHRRFNVLLKSGSLEGVL